MSQLAYIVSNTGWGWQTTCYINYTAVYDPATNKTTVTFDECDLSYYGRNGWGTKAETTITVEATDNTSSTATASFNTSGYTSGSVKAFNGTPSPSTITVTHAAGGGEKQITISGSTKVWVYMSTSSSTQQTAAGSGSQTETSGTSVATYSLSINAGANSAIIVNRISSPDGAGTTGILTHGAIIYNNDVLTVTFSASAGYILTVHTVNGDEFISGNSIVVSSNVEVVSAATLKPSVDASSPIIWIAEIWDGTQWKLYQPGIQTGE